MGRVKHAEMWVVEAMGRFVLDRSCNLSCNMCRSGKNDEDTVRDMIRSWTEDPAFHDHIELSLV